MEAAKVEREERVRVAEAKAEDRPMNETFTKHEAQEKFDSYQQSASLMKKSESLDPDQKDSRSEYADSAGVAEFSFDHQEISGFG